MALQVDISIEVNGVAEQVVINKAYAAISKISGRKRFYVDVSFLTSRDGSLIKSEKFDFLPELDGENYHKQAYDYLKTLTQFDGSIDV